MLANGLYGILLMLGMYWRSIIRYVTIPLCILGVVLSRFHSDTRSQADFIGEVASTEAWKKNAKIVLSAKDFWITAISLGYCTVVKRMGVITPIFLNDQNNGSHIKNRRLINITKSVNLPPGVGINLNQAIQDEKYFCCDSYKPISA